MFLFLLLITYNFLGDKMAKEEFKEFVRKNPKLITYVKDGSMTWQKFYEMHDLYGEDENAWKDYLGVATAGAAAAATTSVTDFMKNIDLDSIQNGVNSMQRILGLFQDIGKNKETKEEYKPRPLYKHFED